MKNTNQIILDNKIIAIGRNIAEKDILKTAEALLKGGVKLLEVTFNQRDENHLVNTPKLISMLNKEFGDALCVGAGTVMNIPQAQAAFDAGAEYFISPNVNVEVIKAVKKMGGSALPGALTPSECVTAYEAGADFVKLFPAGNFSTGYIKSITAPLNHIDFLAVGGINTANVADYMKTGICGVGIGGDLCNLAKINAGEFDSIACEAKKYVDIIASL